MPKMHYWLTGWTKNENGVPSRFLIYGGKNEEEARQKGLEELSGINFNIEPLPTCNSSAASRMLKGDILKETRDLRKATRRLKHKNIRRDFRKATRRLKHKNIRRERGEW